MKYFLVLMLLSGCSTIHHPKNTSTLIMPLGSTQKPNPWYKNVVASLSNFIKEE